jgi:hypothetical protein
MQRRVSGFRIGLWISCAVLFALWASLTITAFFHFIEATDESTGEVISTFLKAAFFGFMYTLYILMVAWWLALPVLGLPPTIGSLLDKWARQKRERA